MEIKLNIPKDNYWLPVFSLLAVEDESEIKDCHLRRVVEFSLEILDIAIFNAGVSLKGESETLKKYLDNQDTLVLDERTNSYEEYPLVECVVGESPGGEFTLKVDSSNVWWGTGVIAAFYQYWEASDLVSGENFIAVFTLLTDILSRWDGGNPLTPVTKALLKQLYVEMKLREAKRS